MIKAYIVFSKLTLLAGIMILMTVSRSAAQQPENNDVVYSYYINSNPFNAEVYYRDSLLGLTPARFTSGEKLTGEILLKKKGYRNRIFNLSDYNFDRGAEIFLESSTSTGEKIVFKDKRTDFVKKRNLTGILVSGFMALTAGMYAYNTKEKANDFYNQYLNNRNQDNLNKSNKYDKYSVLSLGIMQVSVAGLIYFLFLE
jgi:hypothetical protein